ncbi:uncharacterized protein [Lolium perenne]|uniref:uncharacterized protein n=1 Tax=Lolium perenne TaxID=4522 RepID=UPI0021EAA2F0|nr:phytosulfokines 4-like [Lolium perenne]
MARATTLVLVAALAVLLILPSGPARAAAARTAPADVAAATTKASANEKVAAAEDHECETVAGEQQREDCLARRTLAAHTDYIYTQDNGHN